MPHDHGKHVQRHRAMASACRAFGRLWTSDLHEDAAALHEQAEREYCPPRTCEAAEQATRQTVQQRLR